MRQSPLSVFILTALLVCFGAMRTEAAPITVVSVSTTMGSGFGTNLINTVNGVGLTPNTLTGFHASTSPANSWVSSTGILTGLVTFDFGGLVNVGGFSFWNQNAGGPGAAGSTGINGVLVSYSTDGVVFNPLVGGPAAFSRVLAFGPVGPEMFAFAPVTATAFRFTILSNYGDLFNTGFAEVKFDSQAAVPEPASLALLSLGLAGLAARRRLRSR